MINFLQETEEIFAKYGYTWDDVAFIGGDYFSVSIENFREVAASANYSEGYGAQKIAYDLRIVFHDNTWMTRYEYDGSEWWMYHIPPRKPEHEQHINNLCVEQFNEHLQDDERRLVGWCSLENLNYIDERKQQKE